jgi:recombination protein RecR
MQNYPPHLQSLIAAFKKLPGVGSKSAERYAFHLLDWDRQELGILGGLIQTTLDHISLCQECGCLENERGCPFCAEDRAAHKKLCVIASPKEAYAMESTHSFYGVYHVLGGLISPLENKGPETLSFAPLIRRIQALQIEEVVLALDSTVEGDATALYLKRELAPLNLSISRLAFGLPMGSPLDYVDGGTLARAFQGRNQF